MKSAKWFEILFPLYAVASAQGCDNGLSPPYPAPVTASGWASRLIAANLTRPRGLLFDASGNLLVLEQRVGIRRLAFADSGESCLQLDQDSWVVQNVSLTHGIAFSNDGETLFASSAEDVLAWSYDSVTASISGEPRVVVNGMSTTGYVTRTLLMSEKVPGMLIVSRGSGENLDNEARDIETGISQIKAFDVSTLPDTPYNFAEEGHRLGWGLRNSVGVAEEPVTGAVYSVENAANNIQRGGVDIHEENPGEELNFHGYLTGATSSGQGGNYGYPDCFSVWDLDIPEADNLYVGAQFAPVDTNIVAQDEECQATRVGPRLTFPAHNAPLDIKFTSDGSEAYISFHGSLNRDEPSGYLVASVTFADGSPIEPSDSTQSLRPIMSNPDLSICPDNCFRPAGLALDGYGRVFMSSDSTGEIYVLARA
jgi:glucose/arabinose dehydrogenase